jgi:sporulation protein YlmC with PRC-barrel domain
MPARDRAGDVMQHTDSTDLSTWTRDGYVPLGELSGHRMAADEPDVRGWDVLALDGSPLGQVDDLLVDPRRGEIVAVAVRLARGAERGAERGATRRVLPVERMGIVEGRPRTLVAEDAAVADGASSAIIDADRAAPAARAAHTAPAGQAIPAQAIAASEVPQGITVERTADEEIVRVPVVEERLVVERRPVVTDVLVIRKKLVGGGRQVVEADLRKERVEVDRTDVDPAAADRTDEGRTGR